MGLQTALLLAAFVAAVYLLIQDRKGYVVGATLISALELAQRFGWTRLSVRGLPLALILAIALAVCGLAIYASAGGKSRVAAATVICVAAITRVLGLLGVL